MKTAALLAVILGMAVAQEIHRGQPFQNPAFRQQQHQIHQQPPKIDDGQYRQDRQQQQQQYREQQPPQAPSQYQEAAPDRRSTTTVIPILQWNKQQEHDGTYRASYETGNNIISEESGYVKTIGEGEDQAEALVQQGSYSYTSPEGQQITIHYTADETGFHATGDHLPTPPPVSEEIQKGLDLIYAGIRQQQEQAAREAQHQPLNQPITRPDDHSGRYRP